MCNDLAKATAETGPHHTRHSITKKLLPKLVRMKLAEKFISRAAFDPPQVSYRFSSTKKNGCSNIRLMKRPEAVDRLREKGYVAHGEILEGKKFGRLAFLSVVPVQCSNLNECDVVILYAHGSSSDIGLSLNVCIRMLSKLSKKLPNTTVGLSLWDYPGYGLSEAKRPSEEGLTKSVITIYEHITETMNVDGSRIVAMGRSIGSVPISYLASQWQRYPLSKVVLISPIASGYHVFRQKDPNATTKAADPIGVLSTVNSFSSERCPWQVVIFHGDADTTVPIEHGLAILECIRNQETIHSARSDIPAALWSNSSSSLEDALSHLDPPDTDLQRGRSLLLPVPGAGHNDVMKGNALYDSLSEILSYGPSSHCSSSSLSSSTRNGKSLHNAVARELHGCSSHPMIFGVL
eukprot:GHVH01003540.1.p1 GENE.GHVH01003540.1~~GHVH01003540.1.p1  ORF type:complete len:406 (-),score=54.23 GHVH01003540.1:78-1295(-)